MNTVASRNSRQITEQDRQYMQHVQNYAFGTLPTRDETIHMCMKLGFYDKTTAGYLLAGEIPPSTLTAYQKAKLENVVEDEPATVIALDQPTTP